LLKPAHQSFGDQFPAYHPIDKGVDINKLEYYGLEYRYVSRYLKQELTYEDMIEQLNTAIHQFAKRQMTYFRGMERRGITIHWLDAAAPLEERIGSALALIEDSSSRIYQ
jgi:tRNA dimethylallyltransferase